MRCKLDSKRRWKARYRLGKWISREAVENHSLGAFVAGGVWHQYTQMIRRPTKYEAAGGWLRLSGNLCIKPHFKVTKQVKA